MIWPCFNRDRADTILILESLAEILRLQHKTLEKQEKFMTDNIQALADVKAAAQTIVDALPNLQTADTAILAAVEQLKALVANPPASPADVSAELEAVAGILTGASGNIQAVTSALNTEAATVPPAAPPTPAPQG